MTTLLSYCNASTGNEVELTYNLDTQSIVSGVAGDNCQPGATPLAAGTVLFQHTVGGTLYKVRVKNSLPWATVTSEIPDSCEVNITGVVVTPATNNLTNDGVITVNATGNGVLRFSKDGGIAGSFQASNVFSGLAPGSYFIIVENEHPTQGVCTVTPGIITVGFSSIFVCDLQINNVGVTQAPNAQVTQVDYTSAFHPLEPVEYSLDAGAWGSGFGFTGLAAGNYVLNIRFKNFPSCTDSFPFVVTELPTCDLSIQGIDVTHEQSKDGSNGSITMIASSTNAPIEYSKDNGANYQLGNQFISLAPGTYNLRMKDALAGCEVVAVVTILKFREPVLHFPIAQPVRVVQTSGPGVIVGAKQNFDNALFKDTKFKGVAGCEYFNKRGTTDLVAVQYRSSYQFNEARVYGYVDNLLKANLTPIKKTAFFGQTAVLGALFSNAGAGKTQVYFPDTGMPDFIKVGMNITISGQATLDGTYEVEDIANGIGTALGNIVLIVSKTYTSGTDPLAGTVSIVYDIEDHEVWEAVWDTAGVGVGKYYIQFTGTDAQFAAYTARSEPFEVVADATDLLEVAYKNFDNAFLVRYSTGISWMLRVEGDLVWGKHGGEREEMEDSNHRLINLRENVTRIAQMDVDDVPPYLVEKLRLALAHDYLKVNGVEYQRAEAPEVNNRHEVGDPFANISVALRQVDFIAENADDTGDVDATVLEIEEGQVMQLEP